VIASSVGIGIASYTAVILLVGRRDVREARKTLSLLWV